MSVCLCACGQTHSADVGCKAVTARYLVHIGDAQVYVDADLRRCRAPRDGPVDDPRPTYFVKGASRLLKLHSWDAVLVEFSAMQRRRAQLWERCGG